VADRTDVPLRNWSGFALHWNWTYDAIKKLVLAGLTDRAVLNTKPTTRLEMARIVAQAIAKITSDEGGQYADRQDLEDTLYRLLEEFQPELAGLGVEAALQQGPPQDSSRLNLWTSCRRGQHIRRRIMTWRTSRGIPLRRDSTAALPPSHAVRSGIFSLLPSALSYGSMKRAV
jgi:hypothetical protein